MAIKKLPLQKSPSVRPKKTPEEMQAYKIKKAERREKQRITNIKRAETFHQYRLDQKEKPISNSSSLSEKFYIGCSGWFYWDWRGKFYPENAAPSEWFAIYAKQFKTVELNAPFYSWPTLATVKSWARQVKNKKFVYTIKVSELITHIKKFSRTKELIKDFDLIAEELGERMGCFLYQLPPSYHYTAARLTSILKQMIPGRRNVVEFRHVSWWNEKVYEAFRKANIIFCSVSSPKLPDELIKTTDEVYIRFHGKTSWYRHNYSNEEMIIWAERIKTTNTKRAWIYFNNDREAHAIKNAKALAKLLKGK